MLCQPQPPKEREWVDARCGAGEKTAFGDVANHYECDPRGITPDCQ